MSGLSTPWNRVPRFEPGRLGAHPAIADHHEEGRGPWETAPLAVAIPALDEAGRIGACLEALRRELRPGDAVVVAVNNSRDETHAIAGRILRASGHPFHLLDVRWQPGAGSAPLSRQLAMDCAARLAPNAHLLSLDADTMVRPGWRRGYEDLFAQGFDLVCGAIGFLPDEAAMLPPGSPDDERVLRECRSASREIAARLDPDPDNPWPHHANIGGANFGLRAGLYDRLGGVPAVASGEDRELLRRARALGLRLRFSREVLVWTSCRLDGRAVGGLSEELARARREFDPPVDEHVEPVRLLFLRHVGGRRFREGGLRLERFLRRLGFDRAARAALRAEGDPGLGWYAAEALSPVLRRRRLRRSDLPAILPGLLSLRDRLRADADGRGESPDAARAPRFPSPARATG